MTQVGEHFTFVRELDGRLTKVFLGTTQSSTPSNIVTPKFSRAGVPEIHDLAEGVTMSRIASDVKVDRMISQLAQTKFFTTRLPALSMSEGLSLRSEMITEVKLWETIQPHFDTADVIVVGRLGAFGITATEKSDVETGGLLFQPPVSEALNGVVGDPHVVVYPPAQVTS